MGNARGDSSEQPPVGITLAKPFAIGRYEVTVAEWRACAKAGGCSLQVDTTDQTPDMPMRNISYADALEYVNWLKAMTGKPYRLPSEAEWEYAARAGATTRFHFGDDEADYCRHGNGVDATALADVPGARERGWKALPCGDGFAFTAPVGSFAPNAFGLFDTHGNVFEWVEDCWNDNFTGAPADGTAWLGGDCSIRVQRGGAWGYPRDYLRIAVRGRQGQAYRYINAGVRVAREIVR